MRKKKIMRDGRKRLKIGYSDYQQFMDENGYYVDKTLLIKEVLDSAYQILIIPRARRFGKTLNLSMLRYYFDIAVKDTQKLFEPYNIWKEDAYYTKKQGKYPVIFLSLKSGKAGSFEDAQERIYSILAKVYSQNIWLLESNVLFEHEKVEFQEILNRRATSNQYESCLKNLCDYFYRHYGEKTIVLMDEYDAAIHTGFYYGYYDKIIQLMKSLMGSTFKDNPYLEKTVITGILRIAKESIFSDFNNPGVSTVLSNGFADKFGFTDNEVKGVLAYFNLEENYQQIKTWYNGYQFGGITDIYNPWSIINYVERHRDGFKSYWGNSSSDELIKNVINAKDAEDIRADIERLLNGESLPKFISENIVFSDFGEDPEVFWSLLFFSGYLTLNKAIEDPNAPLDIKIPNYEIQFLFKNIIKGWLRKELKLRFETITAMAKSLTTNKIPAFKRYFKRIMGDTFSYFDIHTEPERVYQAYVLGLLGVLADDYIIKSNREAGDGRYDVLLLPRNIEKYGVVIEIKQLAKNAQPKTIEKELKAALSQIQNNEYYKELEIANIQNRIEMSMVFVGKTVHIEVQDNIENTTIKLLP